MMTYRTVIGSFLIATVAAMIPSLASAQVEDDRHAEYARAHITWNLYHETGHAIQAFTGDRLQMSKAEMEIHADKVAAYLMLPQEEDPQEYQLYIDAAMDLLLDKTPIAPGHIYESNKARAERMFCMLYGARPDSSLLGDTERLMNRSAQDCIQEFEQFREETVDLLGFAREFTNLERPQFIDPKYAPVTQPKHQTARIYLEDEQILLDLAIDVEQWLPALQVTDKRFQIVAQECGNYDGFRYSWDNSAVIACYGAVDRCMNRPGHLLPASFTEDFEFADFGDEDWDSEDGDWDDEGAWSEDDEGDWEE